MTAIEKFTRSAAARYLQNIVFVDDEIYDNPSGHPVAITSLLPAFKSPFKKSAAEPTTEIEEPQAENTVKVPYHPKQLVGSFAKEGIVCALYEPEKNFDTATDSEIFKLCERADAVIFDWDLYGEDGNNILPLIKNLVDDSQNSIPHHVRLCVIYTTKPNLQQVANSIFEHLRNANLEIQPVQNPLTLRAGATRIIVLGKPNVTGRTEEGRALEVLEEDLATRVIDEFAKMNIGILPSYALHGMSSIRRNSRKILDKFHGDMDGAFLLHRALTIASEDAFDQLPELLAEEVLSVVLDEQISPAAMVQIANEIANGLSLNLPPIKLNPVQNSPTRTDEERVRMFLGGGVPAIKSEFKFENKEVPVGLLHSAMGCGQSNAEKRLAALFNVRTRYFKSKSPTLGFGAIARYSHEEGGVTKLAFALCLMPICDGIRLKHGEGKLTSFPFWALNNGVKENVNGRGMVVLTIEGDYLELMASGKPRDMLWIDRFKPDESGVVTASKEGESFWFQGEKNRLEWVAQLKPSHAQRIAHDIGQSFSRVGVAEAEWLRLVTG